MQCRRHQTGKKKGYGQTGFVFFFTLSKGIQAQSAGRCTRWTHVCTTIGCRAFTAWKQLDLHFIRRLSWIFSDRSLRHGDDIKDAILGKEEWRGSNGRRRSSASSCCSSRAQLLSLLPNKKCWHMFWRESGKMKCAFNYSIFNHRMTWRRTEPSSIGNRILLQLQVTNSPWGLQDKSLHLIQTKSRVSKATSCCRREHESRGFVSRFTISFPRKASCRFGFCVCGCLLVLLFGFCLCRFLLLCFRRPI